MAAKWARPSSVDSVSANPRHARARRRYSSAWLWVTAVTPRLVLEYQSGEPASGERRIGRLRTGTRMYGAGPGDRGRKRQAATRGLVFLLHLPGMEFAEHRI
jgi:hypothetical protein